MRFHVPGCRKSDYAMWLIMFVCNVRNAYSNIVKSCLEYFFLWRARADKLTCRHDEWSNHLLKNAGFEYLDTKQMLSGVVNLYECRKNKGKKWSIVQDDRRCSSVLWMSITEMFLKGGWKGKRMVISGVCCYSGNGQIVSSKSTSLFASWSRAKNLIYWVP